MIKKVLQAPDNIVLLECRVCKKHYPVVMKGSMSCADDVEFPLCSCGSREIVKDRDGLKPAIYVEIKPLVLEYDY